MIFQQGNSFFRGKDNQDQLIQIAKTLGTHDLIEYMKKYNLPISQFFQRNLGQHPKIEFKTLITPKNEALCNPDALDLLEKMLTYDKSLRITAKEAIQHPYFKPIRDNYQFVLEQKE